MSKVAPIERQIEELDDASFAELRDWFIEYELARWDREHRRVLDREMEEAVRERARR